MCTVSRLERLFATLYLFHAPTPLSRPVPPPPFAPSPTPLFTHSFSLLPPFFHAYFPLKHKQLLSQNPAKTHPPKNKNQKTREGCGCPKFLGGRVFQQNFDASGKWFPDFPAAQNWATFRKPQPLQLV